MTGSAARQTRSTPKKLVSICARASAMGVSSTGPIKAQPALFTTASRPPVFSAMAETARVTESSSSTSMGSMSTPSETGGLAAAGAEHAPPAGGKMAGDGLPDSERSSGDQDDLQVSWCAHRVIYHNVKTSRIVLSFVILFAAGVAAYFIFPPVRPWALEVAGHSPVCPMSHAIESKANMDEKGIKDRILAGSHLVKEDSGLELWSTPKGQFWIPKANRYVLPSNLAEMEQHIYGSGEHFIHAGDVVLDCGASDGDFTRQALEAGAQTVVSIEISPSSVECIRRNLAAETAGGRVIVYPKGVWDKDDTLTLNLVAELKLPRVDFIKMDIEGGDCHRAQAG